MRTVYIKDSGNRRKEFALTTRICIDNEKKIVIKEPRFPEGIPHIKRIVDSQSSFAKYYPNVEINKTWIENDKLYAEFVEGTPLSDLYIKAIQNKDKDKIIELLEYHNTLALGQNNTCVFKSTDNFVKLFGESEIFKGKQALNFTFFDPLAENIILRNGEINRPCFIDYEWFFDFPLPVSILKFKIALQLSLLFGMDDFIPIDERLQIVNCELSFDKGLSFVELFSDFVYKEKNASHLFLNSKYEKDILQCPDTIIRNCNLFFDTGAGYNENEIQSFSFAGNEVEITCQIPRDTIAVRLDPVEEYGCVISNLEVLSYNGIVKHEPINGYKDKDGDMVFTNTDPQISLQGAAHRLKIKYKILFLSELPHYRVLENYISITMERDGLVSERDSLATERDSLIEERERLITERDSLAADHDSIIAKWDTLKAEHNDLVTERDGLIAERSDLAVRYPELATQNSFLFFDTGDGYNDNETQSFLFAGNEVEISCHIPENIVSVRLDPVEGYSCIISDLEILSSGGIVKNEPINGYKNNNGDIVFANADPQIMLHGAAYWLKIKYRILPLSDFSYYRVLDDYITIARERDGLVTERDNLEMERNSLTEERDRLIIEKNNLVAERDSVIVERDELITDRNELVIERDGLINSRSWRFTKPLRKFGIFARRNRALYLFAKGLLSIKRIGIKGTIKKIVSHNKRRQLSSYKAETLLSESERVMQENMLFQEKIKISIISPLYNTPDQFLRQLIDSVKAQTYSNWELCLADGSDEAHKDVKRICEDYSREDNRIKYKKLERNLGISGNSNKALEMATGDYLGFLDHDDMLLPSALYENALAIQETSADVLYSDEEFTDVDGIKHYYPFYKPDWSRDMLYSQMYICHLLVVKKEILDKTGWFNSEFDGSQDYDLMLRLSEHTELIYHIPKLLYSFRAVPTSTSINADSKPYAQDAGLNALNAHLLRRYNHMAHAYPCSDLFVYDTRFDTMQDNPLVSIIIPMRDKAELTDQCIQSIITKSTYKNFEIIVIDNNSLEQGTFDWFCKIKEQESRVAVIKADFDFNWSKLNNYGIKYANGAVYIFLNNDTTIMTGDWIERLCENALREDIGAVGPLLLFDDGTIQHAGVIVGMGGWAEHVFRGMQPVNARSPYVSPTVNRNVLALTGACMCISKKNMEKIGLFSEEFIICGSDIEFCIRAYESGLSNMYNANVRLYHLESKTRDSFIPQIDFQMSYKVYAPYRENIDPYFNPNLDINSVIPSANSGVNMNFQPFKNFLKRNEVIYKIIKNINAATGDQIQNSDFSVEIPETTAITARIDTKMEKRRRLNLLIPSLNIKDVFGGISTALVFFQELCSRADIDSRIIVTDSHLDEKNVLFLNEYKIVTCDIDSSLPKQIVEYSDRAGNTLPVGKNDVFVATGWWTAYCFFSVIQWQKGIFNLSHSQPLIYLIQDYEPCFYSFSSRYLMADSTYKNEIPTIAIFNSRLLHDFFKERGYSFRQEYFFDPVLNSNLREHLLNGENPVRKKQIIVYGRPSILRNAFELIVASLRLWTAQQPNVKEWNILSVGETHPNVELSNGTVLLSLGKLSLDEYAKLMKETYMSVSLMVSPHPSYPPLEMSTFGIRTITNRYANKDLSSFNENIISLDNINAQNISKTLLKLAAEYPEGGGIVEKSSYVECQGDVFSEICEKIVLSLNR